ncbi:MAG: PDZ domain-containing protein, partial [Pseudomonadota bacterium]
PEDAELAEMTESESGETAATAQIDALGITVASLDDEIRQRFEIDQDIEGVAIMSIEPDSPGAEQNLREGDVIVEVGQEPVGSPPEVMARVNRAESEEKKTVLLLINRQGDLHFVALKIG